MSNTTIYALDFDGVICDSAIETSITGWKVAQGYWPEMQQTTINDTLINAFRQIRPYLETGYEAILIIRLLYNGKTIDNLCANYEQQIAILITNNKLDISKLKQDFGNIRDQWIEDNEQEWLANNPLFSGITEKLRALPATSWYIITTKQERFVQRILSECQIELAAERIYGMERGMSKQQVLTTLQLKHSTENMVFVEDRLPTLQAILAKPAFKQISLQLVDWGYNTKNDQEATMGTDIQLITLDSFLT